MLLDQHNPQAVDSNSWIRVENEERIYGSRQVSECLGNTGCLRTYVAMSNKFERHNNSTDNFQDVQADSFFCSKVSSVSVLIEVNKVDMRKKV